MKSLQVFRHRQMILVLCSSFSRVGRRTYTLWENQALFLHMLPRPPANLKRSLKILTKPGWGMFQLLVGYSCQQCRFVSLYCLVPAAEEQYVATAFHGCSFVLPWLGLVWSGGRVSLLWSHLRSARRGFPLKTWRKYDCLNIFPF